MVPQEFKFSLLNGPFWNVYHELHQSTGRSVLVIQRYSPGSPNELVEVEEPKYSDLYKEINREQNPGTYDFRELKLTQAEWCWLRGVLHCLMCINANQVPIEAILVGDSKAL